MSLNRNASWTQSRPVPADFRQVFERFFNTEEQAAQASTAGQWSPRADVREEEQRFLIQVDVPGVDPASIEVSMDKNVLSIKGERAADKLENNGRYTRVERAHGRFERRFSLPETADAEGISASNKFGVLDIVIPKKALSAPRRITINAQ